VPSIRFALAGIAGLLVFSAGSGSRASFPAAAPPEDPVVATLRTSGAQFSMPSGLAYDRAGTLYVADAALQAIFSVDRSGRARLFAGPARQRTSLEDGSYADGPVDVARFDQPMGLAVDARGDLLVADANNHCLRRIHAGVVSTLAGHCTFQDSRDGPASSAYFRRPLALSIDASNGDIYVADFDAGVRKIDAAGAVTTPFPDLPNKRVTGVSQWGDTLLVIDTEGCTILSKRDGTAVRYPSGGPANAVPGFAYSGVALNEHDFVLTDVGMHDLRYLSNGYSRVIAGDRDVDALLDGGGYADGSGESARFNVPLAVAAASDGTLLVADAGNHVLRTIGAFDRGPGEAAERRLAGRGTVRRANDGPSAFPPAHPAVTTVPPNGAHFSMPDGLAYAPEGTLYVADAAMQAIFRVDAAGRTSLFAGPATPRTEAAAGAFADGAAADARFDAPAGLAVDANGDVLVADAGNHCLRKIHAGEVSTLAGRCTVAGHQDGPSMSALFERPLALAIDRARGDVYVADYGGGLRKLDAAGQVTTPFPDLPNDRVTGVALAGYNLLIVDTDGLTLRDLPGGKPIRFLSGSPRNVFEPGAFMSHEFGGFPYAAAPLNPRQFVLTDTRMHDIRYLNWIRSRVIAGSSDVDAGLTGRGYVDGDGSVARFNAPQAIAVAPNGSVVVADTGNHVLRCLGAFDQTWNEHGAGAVEDFHFRRNEYRVALVGNSAVWWSSDTPSSTQAAIARRLAAEPAFAAAGLRPRVVTFGLQAPTLDAAVSAISEMIALEHFDTIVLELNTFQIPGTLGVAHRNVAAWKPYLLANLAALRKELAADHVTLLVAAAPIFGELVPWESYAGFVAWGTGDGPRYEWGQSASALAKATLDSGVPALDLNAPMLADEFSPGHQALFMALDGHYNAYGRAFVGRLIGTELLRRGYWKAAEKR
jgi:DNA-binding beta-propeller fold protein YncE